MILSEATLVILVGLRPQNLKKNFSKIATTDYTDETDYHRDSLESSKVE